MFSLLVGYTPRVLLACGSLTFALLAGCDGHFLVRFSVKCSRYVKNRHHCMPLEQPELLMMYDYTMIAGDEHYNCLLDGRATPT